MATRSKDPEVSTAYHEAGHAVVAWVVNPRVSFKRVTIIPGEGSLGHMLHATMSRRLVEQIEFGSPMGRLRLESLAMVSLAGRIAESKHRGHHARWGHESDYGHVADYCLRVCGRDGEMQVVWSKLMHLRARAMVNQYWPEIQAVAAALREKNTLSLEEFVHVFTDARGLPPISGLLLAKKEAVERTRGDERIEGKAGEQGKK
jgi:hypothetical protein